MVRHLAELFPELPMIVTDALSSPTQAAQFFSDARSLPNVYFETSCAWNVRAIAAGVAALGPERILFGRVSSTHLANFCRQFASYSDAGVDLIKSLTALQKQFARTAIGPRHGPLCPAVASERRRNAPMRCARSGLPTAQRVWCTRPGSIAMRRRW